MKTISIIGCVLLLLSIEAARSEGEIRYKMPEGDAPTDKLSSVDGDMLGASLALAFSIGDIFKTAKGLFTKAPEKPVDPRYDMTAVKAALAKAREAAAG